MKMKKLLFSLFVLAGIAFSLPTLAATTIILSPASVSVTAGQSFNVAVNVDPQAVRNYTVKVALSFPADLLEVDSFTFGASGWMAWNQPGYDLVDNTNGALIKTAGYPGGFSSAAAFGTVSFKAKAAGTAVIQTGSATLALDGASQNVFSGSSQTNVTIVAVNPPIPPAQVLPPKTTTVPPKTQTIPPKTTVNVTPGEQPATSTPQSQPLAEQTPGSAVQQTQPSPTLLASIANILTLGTKDTIIGIIVGLIIIGLIVYGAMRFSRKKRQQI